MECWTMLSVMAAAREWGRMHWVMPVKWVVRDGLLCIVKHCCSGRP